MAPEGSPLVEPWRSVPDRFRRRGMRWTPQRGAVVEVLSRTEGHVTGAELVERCRAIDSTTIPSTVYRTLDVLEELGLVRHGHGADGREEFHVTPTEEHGHLHCAVCGGSWEIGERQATVIADVIREPAGFEIDVSHVTIVGRCGACQDA
ncbi:MAG: Fur family transcriptional regulator [Candidatus Limnocylindria bacterium]